MELIAEITDVDLGLPSREGIRYTMRRAARGVVVKDSKIALLHLVKNRSYKLPGGGNEENESSEETFRREVGEEIGWEVSNPMLIGKTIEIKDEKDFEMMQISEIFLAKAGKEIGERNLDPEEIYFEYETEWVDLDTAIEKLENNNQERYHTKFTTARDLAILNYVKANNLLKGFI